MIVKVPIPEGNESTYVWVLREQSKKWDEILAESGGVDRVAERRKDD